LPDEEFEERFGFGKPHAGGGKESEIPRVGMEGKDEGGEMGDGGLGKREVVFYCRSGVRSKAAAGLAAQAGYEGVGEYRGSWVEWVEREGGGGRGEGGVGV